MRLTERMFDELVPLELRHLSHMHWTPIDVALQVARLLPLHREARVLDIGAGIGKMCAVGALETDATWCGVEQHAQLVAAAQELARSLEIADRTRFVHADAFALDWSEFDALYLYNPFEAPLFATPPGVARVEARLAALPPGRCVVTYNGFGGVMPASFELLSHERLADGIDLVSWQQT
jgi:SAM-dependent methyltransferase